jgi:hypothetical protein
MNVIADNTVETPIPAQNIYLRWKKSTRAEFTDLPGQVGLAPRLVISSGEAN